ncbi:MAG: ABC transporter permease [Tissierellia bacterium]|nr:ABC transporter permease [Tissierellia bacterium]
MEVKVLFRKPWKIILTILFLTLILIVISIFLIQFSIDKKSLDLIIDSYSSVGTVYDYKKDEGNLYYNMIDDEVINDLKEAESISEVEIREAVSAKVPKLSKDNSFFQRYQNNHFIFARVKFVQKAFEVRAYDYRRGYVGKLMPEADFKDFRKTDFNLGYDYTPSGREYIRGINTGANYFETLLHVEVKEIYAGKKNFIKVGDKVVIDVLIDRPKKFTVGDEYLIIGEVFKAGFGTITNSFRLDDRNKDEPTPEYYYYVTPSFLTPNYGYNASKYIEYKYYNPETKKFFRDPIHKLTSEDKDKEALEILEEKGLTPYIEEIKNLDDVVTVRLVKDMDYILPIRQDQISLVDGRYIDKDDYGKNVCVISESLAEKNRLKVGDTIEISLSDTNYLIDDYVSGFPEFGKMSTAEYREAEPFDLIGIFKNHNYYSFSYSQPSFNFSKNDIFIPKRDDVSPATYVNPHSVSFKVNEDSPYTYEEEIGKKIQEKGYNTILIESNWKNVASIYDEMKDRQKVMLFFASVFFVFGGIIFLALITSLNKREFVLRKIFARGRKHIQKSILVPFAISGISAIILSIPVNVLIYKNKVLKDTEFLNQESFPKL